MRHLSSLNVYLWKYRWRFFFGMLFIVLSNYFRILAPQLTGYVIDSVQIGLTTNLAQAKLAMEHFLQKQAKYDWLVAMFTRYLNGRSDTLGDKVAICGGVILTLAILGGFFMFLMRQTIIVMSRHIEYEQKNEIFNHYMSLDLAFYRQQSTGDLMNRISEDVSRVRMYTGPAFMYMINLAATIGFSLYFMISTQPLLTLYVLAPLPLLAIAIYQVNNLIHRRSEKIQGLLSDLTTNAQESYSGIRVIKSFVQEKAMRSFFDANSDAYRQQSMGLAKLEAVYFPSIGLLVGLSTLITIMMGGIFAINHQHDVTLGTIAEFVLYVNMLTFPVSAIGWTASMIQRAAASQKRINEFLELEPEIKDDASIARQQEPIKGDISFNNVSFTYANTGITAIKNLSFHIKAGEKVAIVGHTGSGKTTLAQVLLRLFNTSEGAILIDGKPIREWQLSQLRSQVSYVPQDVFLFSDTIRANIGFGLETFTTEQVQEAARLACVHNEIESFTEKYETMVGERGVTLSGGQKQRISIARALIKEPRLVLFDDCLSAVDAKTEQQIITNLNQFLSGKTALIITHRIFALMDFDRILVLENGQLVESGTHQQLMELNGYYRFLYDQQHKKEAETGF